MLAPVFMTSALKLLSFYLMLAMTHNLKPFEGWLYACSKQDSMMSVFFLGVLWLVHMPFTALVTYGLSSLKLAWRVSCVFVETALKTTFLIGVDVLDDLFDEEYTTFMSPMSVLGYLGLSPVIGLYAAGVNSAVILKDHMSQRPANFSSGFSDERRGLLESEDLDVASQKR